MKSCVGMAGRRTRATITEFSQRHFLRRAAAPAVQPDLRALYRTRDFLAGVDAGKEAAHHRQVHGGDIESLAYLLKRVSSRDRHAADVTLYGLKRALVEVLAFFPVYRSYVSPGSFSAQDRNT